MHDRKTILDLWDHAWADNLGWTPFARVIEGLTPEQAAWKPAPGRHSIWQIVNHLTFWGEYVCARVRGGAAPPHEEIDWRNWEEPSDVTEGAWRDAVERYGRLRGTIRDAIADPASPLDDLSEMLAHHAYHAGQIMQLRALQGLDPIV